MLPKVSVIIPNYNHAKYLNKRIDSVLNQTFKDFELIILDDCSTDESRLIISSYENNPEISQIIYNQINSGSTFIQWKKGIELAKGDYIWIAESDDWAELDFLERLIENLETSPNVGICYCNSNWVDGNDNIGKDLSLHKKSFYRKGTLEIKNHLLKHNTIQNVSSCLFRKKNILDKVENLENYKACGDWLFYIRILFESDLIYIEDKLNNFRWYHQNTSNAAIKSGLTYKEALMLINEIKLNKLNLSFKEINSICEFWNNRIKDLGILFYIKSTIKLRFKLIASKL